MGILILVGIIPAIFLVGIGLAFRPVERALRGSRDWAWFLLAALALILGLFLLAGPLDSGRGSVITLLFLPALLVALVEIVFILGEQFSRRLALKKLPVWLLLLDLALIIAVDRLVSAYLLRSILVAALALALAWLVLGRIGSWSPAGYLLLVCLLLAAVWAADVHFRFGPDLAQRWLSPAATLVVGLGIVVTVRLLGLAWSGELPPGREAAGWRWRLWASLPALPLLGLVWLYTVTLSAWDVATDGLYGVSIQLQAGLFAVAAAALLAGRAPAARRWLPFGFALVLCISVAAAARFGTFGLDGAWGNVPHARTARRADAVASALQRYHADRGMYPPALSDLAPAYLLYLPRPFVIPGQDWCYQSGPGYFRLGYVNRDYFSTPAYVTLHASAGQPPEPGWPCDEQAAGYPAPEGISSP